MDTKIKYKTKQRKVLQEYLETVPGKHITVSEICDYFKGIKNPIGQATVYRNLEAMVDEGLVNKYIIDANSPACFEFIAKALTQYRRKHLGYVFQLYNLIPNLNVKENIEVGAYLSDNPLDIDDLLKTLGLFEHRYKLPNQLSGGQQQRVSIGRAIVKNPDILLCDEPTGALDYNTSKEILRLINDVNTKYGNTIIMVTHNEEIKKMADHVIKLRDGVVRHNNINESRMSVDELDW